MKVAQMAENIIEQHQIGYDSTLIKGEDLKNRGAIRKKLKQLLLYFNSFALLSLCIIFNNTFLIVFTKTMLPHQHYQNSPTLCSQTLIWW